MHNTYRAVLKGNQIQWLDKPPAQTHDVEVSITVVRELSRLLVAERGRKMALALEQLAKANPLAGLVDPVAWQRELRVERTLPQRS